MVEASILLIYLILPLCFLYLFHLFINDDGIPWNWPFIGMAPGVLRYYREWQSKIAEVLEKGGGSYSYKGVWFTNTDFIGTGDPENVRYVMSTNSANYVKGEEWKNGFDVFGDGLFNSEFEAWKHNRKAFHAFLNHEEFHQSVTKIIPNQIEKSLIPVLNHVAEQDLVVDLQDLFARNSFDVASIIATGHNSESLSVGLPEVPFFRAMSDAWGGAFFRYALPDCVWKVQRWLRIGREKRLSDAGKALDGIFAEYISLQRRQLENNGHHKGDGFNFLKCYLTGHEVTGPTPTDKLMRDNALNMIFAIEDTTSSALTWFFWILSKHPLIVEKIREEIITMNVLVKEEGALPFPLDLKDINKLVYLHAALCETLRLFPPVPFEFRTAVKSDVLPSGHRVKKNARIMVCIQAMGRMKSTWGEDCREFKPERWITAERKIKREPPNKFCAFMAGPRICLGKEFAFTLLKATAASVIFKYNVEVVSGQNVTPKPSVIFKMKHGLKARIKRKLD